VQDWVAVLASALRRDERDFVRRELNLLERIRGRVVTQNRHTLGMSGLPYNRTKKHVNANSFLRTCSSKTQSPPGVTSFVAAREPEVTSPISFM
jgi:hypothetical protein